MKSRDRAPLGKFHNAKILGNVCNLAVSKLCIADSRIAFKVPENITLEQAATIPLAATTAFLALFSEDCLHLDRTKPTKNPVLVLGGASEY